MNEQSNTHAWILNRAIELLARSQDPQMERMGGWMLKYRVRIARGDHDADHVNPFCNMGWHKFYYGRLFTSHFYDPDSLTNWKGEHSPTARSEGGRHFQHAGRLLQAGDYDSAFYYLGISLHYLADVTMPFHAANFTYLCSNPRGYHAAAEQYAARIKEEFRVTGNQGCFWRGSADPGQWIHRAAVRAKAAFPSLWNPAIEGYWKKHQTAKWQDAIKAVLGEQLKDAQKISAGYIDLWFRTYDICLIRSADSLDRLLLSDTAGSAQP